VSGKIENPISLDIGITAMSNPSSGTLKILLANFDIGQSVRRTGKLKSLEIEDIRKIRFSDKERMVRPVTMGDLSTAYRTTGIPNITTYFTSQKNYRVYSKSAMTNYENTRKMVNSWVEENIYSLMNLSVKRFDVIFGYQ